MYETTYYTIDPASTAYHRFVFIVLFTPVLLASIGLVVRFGWRSWWAVTAIAICLPTIFVVPLGGGATLTKLPLLEFVLGIAAPLALVGLATAAIGSVMGATARWLTHSKVNLGR